MVFKILTSNLKEEALLQKNRHKFFRTSDLTPFLLKTKSDLFRNLIAKAIISILQNKITRANFEKEVSSIFVVVTLRE